MNVKNKLIYLCLLAALAFLAVAIARYASVLRMPVEEESKTFRALLKIDLYDYYSGGIIKNAVFHINVATRRGESLSVQMFSGENGTATAEIPLNLSSISDLSFSRVTFSGIWVLEKVAGRDEYTLADGRWSLIDGKIFLNSTEYLLRNLLPSVEEFDNSTSILKFKFFLAEGRPIAVFNPINEATRMDPRLKIKILFTNFAESRGTNFTIVPLGEPLIINASVSYMDFSWIINVSFDPGEKIFVDLTPIFVRAASSSQLSSLTEMIDTLEPHGFDVEELRNKISQISLTYEEAAQQFENQRYEDAVRSLYRAQVSYRDTYMAVINIYTNVIGWAPTLLTILIFFSFSLSRLFTEKRTLANIIFMLLLLITITSFLIIHPGFRFFILGFHQIFRKIAMPSLATFLSQIIQAVLILAVIIAIMFTRLKDLISQTFGLSIRNLRRHGIRTLLALSTLVLISASAMCLLTFSPTTLYWRPVYHLKPKVDNGLVVYKQMTMVMRVGDVPIIVEYVALQPYEVSLFLKDWVESANIFGIKTIQFSRADGFTIDRFNTFSMALVDPGFMEKYLNVSEVFNSKWLSPSDRNMILIGSRIASRYNLTEGSNVLINDKTFTVKAIFNEMDVAEKLMDLDGERFLIKIYNPMSKRITGESFILGSVNDFGIQEMEIYKVSIIFKDEYVKEAMEDISETVTSEFDYWETENAEILLGFLVRFISNGSLMQVYSYKPLVTFFGDLQSQMIPLTVTSLILLVNALGTIFERRSEIRTIFTVGASPTRIRLIFAIEGLVLGIMGGLLGYVLGYMISQVTMSILPSLVQKNLISGTPFTIAFLISTVSSLIGYSISISEAVKVAVPSGMINVKISEIVKIDDKIASLEVPLKLKDEEFKQFDVFIEDMIKSHSESSQKGIIMNRLSSAKLEEKNLWSFTLKYCEEPPPTNFQISLLAGDNKELKIIIEPLSIGLKKLNRWTMEHKTSLVKFAFKLREEILKFTIKKAAVKNGGALNMQSHMD